MKIGFVGAGNMATALARGWKAAEGEPGAPEAMLFSDADPERAHRLAEEVGGEAVGGNRELAESADLIVLAVKPNTLDEVAGEVAGAEKPVISILAGTTVETLERALPGVAPIRVMPNLGAQVREAVLCVVYGDRVDPDLRKRAEGLLALVGEVIELDEGLIDAATAIMGCTPGYLALMAEALVEAGRREGLTERQSQAMAAKAMSATGGLLEIREPSELRKAVASPGGMTEAGLEALEERDFRGAIQAAVDASLARVRG